MLYAVLVCSDPECDIAYEAWGEANALEQLQCEECGSPLELLGFANADRDGVVPGSVELQQRRAA
jgi:hypothetical protein